MRPGHLLCAIMTTAAGISLAIGWASASVLPTSVSLGLGVTRDLHRDDQSLAAVPDLALTWRVIPRLALRSTAGYIRERVVDDGYSDAAASGNVRYSRYLPIGLGLRLYPAGVVGDAPGLYVDAIPVLHVSRVRDYFRPDWNMVALGFEAGVGARFGMWGRSRGEVGAVVHHIDNVKGESVATEEGQSARRGFQSREFYMIRVSLGFGD